MVALSESARPELYALNMHTLCVLKLTHENALAVHCIGTKTEAYKMASAVLDIKRVNIWCKCVQLLSLKG